MSADSKPFASLATVAASSVGSISQQHHQHQQADRFATTPSTTPKQDGPQQPPPPSNDKPPFIHRLRPSDKALSGGASAFINITLLFPINKLIFRQIAGGYNTSQALSQIREEGLRYLYRGILPPLAHKVVACSLMFGTFDYYHGRLNHELTQAPFVLKVSLAALMSGSTEAVLTPLERVQMLLQDRSHNNNYKHTLDALVKLWPHGWREYYRGVSCVLLRNGPSNVLFFGLRDEIKKLMPEASKRTQEQQQQLPQEKVRGGRTKWTKDSLVRDFLAGAILGMFISTLFYPLSVVRTRMQTRVPGTKFLTIMEAFEAVYNERDRKFSRLFHGCSINIARQFFSWGIINSSNEMILDKLEEMD